MLTEKIINNINLYIKEKNIKQTWIADMLGMNKMVLSNILNLKNKNVSLEVLNNIANALDLTIEELSQDSFIIESKGHEIIDITEPEVLLYGEGGDAQTTEIVKSLLNIMNVIDSVMTANEKMKSLNF